VPGSQDFTPDPRNDTVSIYLNGALVPKLEARVSVFDAGFVLGDGVWEGLRLHHGALLFLEAHLDRLYAGAAAIRLNLGLSRAQMIAALYDTCRANNMADGVHLRLMCTRGVKAAVNQDPRNALGAATIVIVAEYKLPSAAVAARGLNLATSSIRCTGADTFDMRLNSHSRLNLIRALIDVLDTGADEALMVDPHGFVSSCNATNFFWVKSGEARTSRGDFCFHGVTRGHVIDLCRAEGVPIALGNYPLADVHDADEAFVTGTFGGITPVRAVDGHVLRAGVPGPMTARLIAAYGSLKDRYAGVAGHAV
jgi:branched-chain amino acid aminotransferase